MTTQDMDLVREYALHGCEEAFATLVSRHVNLVYSVALRRLGDAHLAEEVTQAAFIILARKAGSLGPKTILSAWLCRTAQYVSARASRNERRRQNREQEIYMQTLLNQPDPETSHWSDIAPLLDVAMARLGEKDHSAIVLRFFDGKDLKQVAAALGVSENAARTRVSRAVEKLRQFFVKRGVILSATVIVGAISTNSVQAAPTTLAKTVTSVALGKGVIASSSTLSLIKGALRIMAWTKAKTAILAGVVVLLAAGTTTVAIKEINAADQKSDVATFQGTWNGLQVHFNHRCSLIVTGNNYEFQDDADTNAWNKGTFTLQEDTHPRQCIFTISECHIPEYVGKTVVAIYRLEGGKLTITWNAPGNSAVPAAFDASGAACMELKREEKRHAARQVDRHRTSVRTLLSQSGRCWREAPPLDKLSERLRLFYDMI
jgi:RNA polymerase sigma factor (sigma-70 family)